MAITPQYPSGYNTYVPNTQATNNLIIDFARNPKDFKLNQYIQVMKVSENVGMYTRMTNEVCARFLNANNSVWADGAERPLGVHNLESFANETYRTIRRTFPTTLGYLASKQASWNMVAQYQNILATQAMTARSILAVDALLKATNYDVSHVVNVTSSYGAWDASTTATGYIKATLYDAINTILKDTLGFVRQEDLILVVSAEAASKIMQSQEIVDYIKGTPDSWPMTKGTLEKGPYGLPPTLYGVKVVVEDAVKVTSPKGVPRVTEWLWPKDKAILCARPGGIEAFQGPSFSTCVIFAKEEMTAESFDDAENRRLNLCVTEDYCAQVIAPVSGVVLTNLLTAN